MNYEHRNQYASHHSDISPKKARVPMFFTWQTLRHLFSRHPTVSSGQQPQQSLLPNAEEIAIIEILRQYYQESYLPQCAHLDITRNDLQAVVEQQILEMELSATVEALLLRDIPQWLNT